jgi:predicted RNA binding protein YcfA (HicA-like mRNA interferase family)
VNGEAVSRRIVTLGGEMVRQVGSHRRFRVVFHDADGKVHTVFTTVPMHRRDLPIGTLRSIQRDLAPALGGRWLT